MATGRATHLHHTQKIKEKATERLPSSKFPTACCCCCCCCGCFLLF